MTHSLLAGAWENLGAAAGDLRLLASATADGALGRDARVLADALERELDALAALGLRWQWRRGV
ncbi:MAG: hypothetical protein M3376_12375 [Actinomycetota bacterium]|nr:hypothetical protein [Actinomycetota bacterium]